MKHKRRNHYDVTDRVRISHPGDVEAAASAILRDLYPAQDLAPVQAAFEQFTALYAGTLPGYIGCDTWYHDAQHSLDCTLAMVRLFDGYERSVADELRLGPRRAVLGLIIALFHDAGYIRRTSDSAVNGAEFTLNHVRRSAEFLADFLPKVGFEADIELTRQVVHFTGYEVALDNIDVKHPKDRMLGFMLGTADILAQTSDRCYLEKCRDYLFREFEICGLAGTARGDGKETRYPTAAALLLNTPEFNQHLWEDRLDGYFGSVHRFMEQHFRGRNPYVEQIREHLALIKRLGRGSQFHKLSKKPEVVDGPALRRQLGIKLPKPPTTARQDSSGRLAHALA